MPEPDRHTRYRQGLCVDCGQKRYSAGRPRCTGCHDSYTNSGKATMTVEVKVLGVTGTREAITAAQRNWLNQKIRGLGIAELHHGACVGADLEAHVIAADYGAPIVVHPPVDQKLAAAECLKRGMPGITVLPAEPYHKRNRAIVAASDLLLALPNSPYRARSGTWYTVLHATGRVDEHVLKRAIPVHICYPNGRTETRHQPDTETSHGMGGERVAT